ncbi:unnamed protein product, partial [Wuchereria bancrofti]
MKKALLAQVAFVILYCTTIVVAIEKNDVNVCKRQPFRGRCPSVGGKGPARSQFVLRYYLRDNECVSYPFGHCANDENEPVLYRYKEECEKACLNKWDTNDTTIQSTTIQNDNEMEKSENSSISSGITDNDNDSDSDINVQISTTLSSSSFPIIDNNNDNNDTTIS